MIRLELWFVKITPAVDNIFNYPIVSGSVCFIAWALCNSLQVGFATSRLRQLKRFLSGSIILLLPSAVASRRILIGLELLHILWLVLVWAPDSALIGEREKQSWSWAWGYTELEWREQSGPGQILGMCNAHPLFEAPQWTWAVLIYTSWIPWVYVQGVKSGIWSPRTGHPSNADIFALSLCFSPIILAS